MDFSLVNNNIFFNVLQNTYWNKQYIESGFNSEALVKAFNEAVKLPLAKYASPRHSHTWLKQKHCKLDSDTYSFPAHYFTNIHLEPKLQLHHF